MTLRETLFGRPLRSEEQEAQKIGPMRGVPVLGLDSLASAAYGPEAALTVMIGLGAAATGFIAPVSAAVIVLLFIVFLSYRQTIAAYPNGGGAYTVASENLGRMPGLLGASALTLDYILNVAVAISAGVGAIVSAAPRLLPYTLPLCLLILVLLTIVNLRGVREAGLVFMVPTYAFLALLGITIAVGIAKTLAARGHPVPVLPPPASQPAVRAAGLWMVLHAFAGGSTALTGVEAVSNGVPLFKEPMVKQAQRTLTAIIVALAVLLAGVAFLARHYGITATVPGAAGYQSVLSQIVSVVMGRGAFYYATIIAVVLVLCLSANTSFAGFPRLCRMLALDDYLPAEFAHPGRRLVFSTGIIVLALIAAVLLIVFGGITDRLIPLFAVGAFLAFTISQAGMVVHWRRRGGALRELAINAIGTVATAVTLVVIVAAKFTEGAWVSLLLIPIVLATFIAIRRNQDRIDDETEAVGPLRIDEPPPPIVVVPIKRLDRVARKALRFAVSISPKVQAMQVFSEDLDMENLRARWNELVERPVREAGFDPPELVLLRSPYRDFLGPLLGHVRALAKQHPGRYVAVVVPELIERRWYHFLLHSHRPTMLKAMLLLRGGPHVIVINTPWYLRDTVDEAELPTLAERTEETPAETAGAGS